jgi:cytoskeletal protein RodZ
MSRVLSVVNMPLQNRTPGKRKKKNDQRWLLPALLVPVVLAVAGLQWWQTRQPSAPIPLPPADGRIFGAGTPPSSALTQTDRPEGAELPAASPRRPLGTPVPLGQGNVQSFTPQATEPPLAAPRQIGSYERLPEAGAAQRSADDGARHPLCDSLDKQRAAAEEQLKAATSPSEKRTFTHERDTALQNLKSLGCFN